LYSTLDILFFFFFFFNDTATTEIYTLSLHDALPILYLSTLPGLPEMTMLVADVGCKAPGREAGGVRQAQGGRLRQVVQRAPVGRSEEHTSELQSRGHLVCRLLLEKKKHKNACIRLER